VVSWLRGMAVDTSALRYSRDYRLLVLGGFVSGLGTQVTLVALPYQVYVQTRSPLLTGLLGAAELIPPGLDLRPFTPVPPSDRPRPLVVHAPSNREKKGTRWVIEACDQLDVDLDVVEGVPHDVARERYARADIVVDQLNAGWHGVFALESMALGKPVVTYLKPDVVEISAQGYGIRLPVVPATKETLVDVLRPLVEQPALRRELGAASRAYVEQVHDIDRVADRLVDLYRSL